MKCLTCGQEISDENIVADEFIDEIPDKFWVYIICGFCNTAYSKYLRVEDFDVEATMAIKKD